MSKTDANDYSRFTQINDSDDEADSTSKSTGQAANSTLTILERITEAHRLKDTGNNAFKSQDLKSAKEAYEDALSKVNEYATTLHNIPDIPLQTELRNLFVSIRSNLAMVAVKEESWSQVITQCNHALSFDSNHVKSLFRRGSAKAKIFEYEESKEDLKRVLELEPSNNTAKKELSEVVKTLKEHNSKSKSAFGNIFNKGSVYNDKETERRRKEELRIEAKMAEERAWQQDNDQRKQEGNPEQTLEEYRQAIKDKDTFKEEESPNYDNVNIESTTSSGKAVATSATNSSLSIQKPKIVEPEKEEEYDEEEAKILAETKAKGYCYFRTPTTDSVSSSDKSRTPLPDCSPKVIASSGDYTPTPIAKSTHAETPTSTGLTTSSWNTAGTWEERDCTDLVKNQLSSVLNRVAVPSCNVSKVEKVEGEAQIVWARGKKRHLFDFTADVDLSISLDGSDKARKVSLSLTDISPQSILEYTVKWPKSYTTEVKTQLLRVVTQWHQTLRTEIAVWEEEYKAL